MNALKQFLIILGLYFTGEVVHGLFHLPIPGNIIGMILLLFGLLTKVIKLEMIEELTNFLLDNLAFFFVPAGVGLITTIGILKSSWYKILIICIVSTIIVLFVTSKSIEIIKKIQKR
jgi:holin-like protein